MLLENENALKAEDVAKILKIGRNAVYSMAKSGELRSYHIGRKLRFTYADIQAYIDSSKTGTLRTQSSGVPAAQPGEFVLCGQEEIADLLAEHARRRGAGVTVCRLNSYDALIALYKGQASAACCSLFDADTESCNLPFIKKLLPGTNAVVIQLASIEVGLLVREGNPKHINGIEGLCQLGVRLANREHGSSERVFLDGKLQKLGISPATIDGYTNIHANEVAMAAAVAQGLADAGICRRQAASRLEGVEFISLGTQDYALVLREETLKAAPAKTLLEVLSNGELQGAFSCTSGVDTSSTGRYIILR